MATAAISQGAIDDNQLMVSYAAGETMAFETLYERHRLALYRFLVNSISQEAIAAELYQDIWMRVIDRRHQYRSEVPFRAWLYRIARNRLTDHYRQSGRVQTQPFDETTEFAEVTTLEPPLQPAEVTELLLDNERLNSALATLPDNQREVVLLKHVAGMSLAEIAALTGETGETVKSRLRYALVKLRHVLRGTMP